MAQSIRSRILDAVKTKLEAINGAGVFETTVDKVFDQQHLDPQAMGAGNVMLAYRQLRERRPENLAGLGTNFEQQKFLDVVIDGLVRKRGNLRLEADKLIDDIERAFNVDQSLGIAGVSFWNYEPGQVVFSADGNFASVEATATFISVGRFGQPDV